MKPIGVLILGAGGQIARHVVRVLQNETAIHSTLFLRDAGKLKSLGITGMTVVEGDVGDETTLRKVIAGKDIVVASLAGDMEGHARHIVNVMKAEGAKTVGLCYFPGNLR